MRGGIAAVGMSFDFMIAGQVCITMPKCVDDILSGCGVETTKVTPASSVLFDVRDALKASDADAKWFHTYVAKILYLAKRVRPECLTAVTFLSTRVVAPDIDDLAKLRRLLSYIRLTSTRGIVLRVGPTMVIKAYMRYDHWPLAVIFQEVEYCVKCKTFSFDITLLNT